MQFVEAPNNFYLGARIDPETGQVIENDIVYYDARDLTTHAVILGMTGSGKTGLAITILEEAVIDGIPNIIIDPKGDITNMLLAFPDFDAQYFLPWINPEDATREDHTLEQHAQVVADRWRKGLADWGITNDRVQEYRRAARFSIYTPGSEAGLPISILQSFAAPAQGWAGNEEALREQIADLVTAILGLVGVDGRPVESREHILLSNIFEFNWRNNVDLSMEQLILQVQKPPFAKLGVLDVENIFPEADRFKLAKSLNNIIATPSFQNWMQGEPINIPSLLYTPDGYPRSTIFYLAHLNDAERQFIITLLLDSIISWMRTLSGSTSLRTLIYIDECFGMMPPYPRNPPTKDPIMRLLKQGRAFGLGLILGTQNPKDIDYKGLSNAGTWFIGKLQTENDKQRVLEGLDSARDATSALDLNKVASLIGRLGTRQFIMHNVHEQETPILMTTRWTMSYLRGPLTRPQISQLMANQRGLYSPAQPQASYPSYLPPQASYPVSQQPAYAQPPAPAAPSVPPTYSVGAVSPQPAQTTPQAVPQASDVPPGFSAIPPMLPTSIYQYYLPTDYTVEQAIYQWESWTRQPAVKVQTYQHLLYRPALLAQAVVRLIHRTTNTSDLFTYAFVVPTLPRVPYLNWAEYQTQPFDPHTLDREPFAQACYADVPSALATGTGFKDLQNNLIDWLYQNVALTTYYNPVLKLYSSPGESRRDFTVKVQAVARQERDKEVDQVAARYDQRLAALEARYQKKQARLAAEKEELSARKQEELLTAGESLMQLFKGRAYYTLSRTSRMRRYTTMSHDQVGMLEGELEQIRAQFEATQQEMEQALQAVQEKWRNAARQIEEMPIRPYKKDITVVLFGIGWVPYWDVLINDTRLYLPASSSGLSQAQDPTLYGGGYTGGYSDSGQSW
jgi:hypothetical protein